MVCPICNGRTKGGQPCKRHTCKFAPKCFQHTKVQVGASNIPGAGRGIFAKTDINRSEVVANYTVGTERLNPAQFRANYPSGRATHVWAPRGSTVYYDATDASKSVAGMANRGARNNARITGGGRIKAKQRIPRGREILVSYGAGYRM